MFNLATGIDISVSEIADELSLSVKTVSTYRARILEKMKLRTNAELTPSLVTRHSLREQRKGATILLVDPTRESQILAAHILGRQDCSLVVANDLNDTLAALDQDVYDIVLVDTSLPGLGGNDAAKLLRSRITRDPDAAMLVAVSVEHSPAFRAAKIAIGFNTTVGKPFRKDDLLGMLASLGRQPVEAM